MSLLINPTDPEDLAAVARLFRDYAEWLKADICLYDFEEEMQRFPAPYVPPLGALFLAKENGRALGAVGVRPIGDKICEMKRMYVHEAARGSGLGRRLAEATLAWAKDAGYHAMRLDTLPKLTAARALYEGLGFTPCAPYNVNPADKVLFYEKDLRPSP
jgi:GNAT superfamily N-acetyltransferase